ncbi:PAS domain S-box-containing protein [Kushneria avicenniae]|uniref:PAS domain S-box-containing protein n=1 Tax=Kushneria avicenniae TaxID=402385 RepID=A0A1I1MKT5_9GAMM|nr:sigma 54-interacting transcriptional regulator [Kushneria avicenniae]SFC86047.1 PAS domain S-box-containing protein [Kushneria avicenniae]
MSTPSLCHTPSAGDIDQAVLTVLLASSHDHLVITDHQGNILQASPGACAVYGLSMAALCSTSVQTLEAQGVLSPSVTTRVLDSGAPAQLMQTTPTGRRVLAEAQPVYMEGQLVRVVSRSRDLTDLRTLQEEYALLSQRLNEQLRHHEIEALREALAQEEIDIHSRVMRDVAALLERVADTSATVMLLGESGVGKTALARQVHRWSARASGPFIDINCSAIPETLFESEVFGHVAGAFSGASRHGKPGLLEQAEGGTLFLDEVAELPLAVQAKLLRVLQDGMVMRLGDTVPRKLDFRLIVATNQDLAQRVDAGAFRLDLYYRLNVIPVHIPPLRERREDIPALVERQMQRLNTRYGLRKVVDERLWGELMNHDWPGNVRELENVLERAWLTSDVAPDGSEGHRLGMIRAETGAPLQSHDAHDDAQEMPDLATALLRTEYDMVVRAARVSDSTYALARRLGISQPSAVRKLKRHGIRLKNR